MSALSAPALEGDAQLAVEYRGGHMQIIASAGSGKTEVVAQRVAALLADGVAPDGIVAFTFTERAAAELKARIARRVEERLGRAATDQLGRLFVGTIHAYCFRLLQTLVPRYETYDVLDTNQLTAFLARESNRLEIRRLDNRNRLFSSVELFLRGLEAVENELIDPSSVPGDFGEILKAYVATLERYRLLTFGQQVSSAVAELGDPAVAAKVHSTLRHLIVDEYQDVNFAQEQLIARLVSGGAHLCVVGDDDQAIYQWRGSDVANIVEFDRRYAYAKRFEITANRRSRPTIVGAANAFAQTIQGRLDKKMEATRKALGAPEVVAWSAPSEAQEAGQIADHIAQLRKAGVRYGDVALLVRGRVAYPELLANLGDAGIPVQPGGRTGLFDQPEATLLGKVFCWLGDIEWGRKFGGPRARIDLKEILDGFESLFGVPASRRSFMRTFMGDWQRTAKADRPAVDLVGEYYALLDELEVHAWDLSNPLPVNRLGTLARFCTLLTDYENVRRRARLDPTSGGVVGGEVGSLWFYKHLGIHIVNYASDAYGDFDGEPDVGVDAVDVLTVHSAKGLEWPVVFLPSLVTRRFPSSKTGQVQEWPFDRSLIGTATLARYEGSDNDERRLFYVAMTRARDLLSVSRFERRSSTRAAASPYFLELSAHHVPRAPLALGTGIDGSAPPEDELLLTYSELAQFLECGMEYRLRTVLGFQPRLAPELGYGKAVHHMLRRLAEFTKERGEVPNLAQIQTLLNQSFFLPTANKAAHQQMKDAARNLLHRYVNDQAADLFRVWEMERPFELRLDGVTIAGRADVILDYEDGVPSALAILDYKTSTGHKANEDLQLQVYAAAGVREGLDVRAGYLHDLKAGVPIPVAVDEPARAAAEAVIRDAAVNLRSRTFTPNPGDRCRSCEVRSVCSSRAI